jgi:hypothetical protein
MALVDRITWGTDESNLREYLGVDTGEDLQLQLWLEAAVEEADLYLCPDTFQDAETGDDLPIPSKVYLGIYEWVRVLRNTVSTNVAEGPTVGAAKSIKTGDNTITYDAAGVLEWTQGSARTDAARAAQVHWCSLRPDPLLGL